MTQSYTLTTIQQAVTIGTTLSKSWFRGHSKVQNSLTPRIFRDEFSEGLIQTVEFETIVRFKRDAPSLANPMPYPVDDVSWLFLMQHHGAPTRLLDWSESILTALFFAVSENRGEDGELWAMYPQALNFQYHESLQADSEFPMSDEPVLQFLVKEPLFRETQSLANELGLDNIPISPLAVNPPMHFPRMVSQLSRFTIHPKPITGYAITDLLAEERHLVRYVIPSNRKRRLLQDLSALGFRHHTLFPDLDALSRSIIEENKVILYGPPIPPHAAEQVCEKCYVHR